jgi:hypothetical protein
VEGIGEVITEASGTLRLKVPAKQRQVRVTLEGGQTLTYEVGGVEPIETAAGLQMRLAQLGYGGDVTAALSAFARAEGLDPAARGEATARLEKRFGC